MLLHTEALMRAISPRPGRPVPRAEKPGQRRTCRRHPRCVSPFGLELSLLRSSSQPRSRHGRRTGRGARIFTTEPVRIAAFPPTNSAWRPRAAAADSACGTIFMSSRARRCRPATRRINTECHAQADDTVRNGDGLYERSPLTTSSQGFYEQTVATRAFRLAA